MDSWTEPESLAILTRLEEVVTALEADLSPHLFYTVLVLAQEFAAKTRTPFAFPALRRCLTLAARLRPIRHALLGSAIRWAPLTEVVQALSSELTQLSSLYGVARRTCRDVKRALQPALRDHFTRVTGQVYRPYHTPQTRQEATAVVTFWDAVFAQALATFMPARDQEALDRLLACLPAWSSAHEGARITRDWQEPSVKEVMQVIQDALGFCEGAMATVAQIATDALAQRPVVERAQVTQDLAPQYADQVQTLRTQLAALPRPKDTPKAQHAALRHTKAQLQLELTTLLDTQETAIQRQVTASTNARRKLAKLIAKAPQQRDALVYRVSKVSRDVLPQMVWIYDYERHGDEEWRAAKREARRFLRTLRQAREPGAAAAAP